MSRKNRTLAPCTGHHFTHSTPPLFVLLLPSQIRFTRHSVSPRLTSGVHVIDLLKRCLYGDITTDNLTHKNRDLLTVMESGGYYWVIEGHKRLWVLKEMEKLKLCEKIAARVRRRRDYSYWMEIATTACEGKELEFDFSNESERVGFNEQVKQAVEDFKNFGSIPFQVKPATSRFFESHPLTPAQIMCKRVDDHFKKSGSYQWFRGPYNVERKMVLGFILLFFLISLSALGKIRPELEES